eukprot:5939065-Pyramimonas_sp.AAC.1
MPSWVWVTHAGGAIGGAGGAPYWATKRCTVWVRVTKWVWGARVGGPTGGFGGAPYGPTKR